jgi:hypothetical protein
MKNNYINNHNNEKYQTEYFTVYKTNNYKIMK